MDSKDTQNLRAKYRWTALFYDILDYPWERQYRHWRKDLLGSLDGHVLEAGVGTGRNFIHYPPHVTVTGFDLSPTMLSIAKHRANKAACPITLKNLDVTDLNGLPNNYYDWVISTFLCCVLPNTLQSQALNELVGVLKPGGRFKLLEMVYSKDPKTKRFQERISLFVNKVYGAGFDRETLKHVRAHPSLTGIKTRFLRDDTYLLIEGQKTVVSSTK